jgi:hypothetical protein
MLWAALLHFASNYQISHEKVINAQLLNEVEKDMRNY